MHFEMVECRVPFWGQCQLGFDLWSGEKSEYGHIAYQIKGNKMYDKMQAVI